MDFKHPTNFSEYLEQFPDWHKIWLRKHCPWLDGKVEDFEDAAQHLLLETLRRQRIEQYDPAKMHHTKEHKDTAGLFLHWLAKCFRNDLRTKHSQAHTKSRRGGVNTVSLDDFLNYDNGSDSTSEKESIGVVSQAYALKSEREGEKIVVAAQLAEFRAFLATHRPDMLPVLDKLHVAISEEKTVLAHLAAQMEEGIKPTKRRLPYKRIAPRKGAKGRAPRFTAEQVAAVAARGLTAAQAGKILRCSDSYIGQLAIRFFGLNWRELVRSERAKAAAK